MKSNEAPRAGLWTAVILMACLLPAGTLAAQERDRERGREEQMEHIHWILEGLERGMESTRALERRDLYEMLDELAEGVRRRMEHMDRPREREGNREREGKREREGGNEERRNLEGQTEVLRLAMRALLEGERHDAAELLEHAIHARELFLEGRRDREAQEIREGAPSRGQVQELLALSERLYREFDLEEMADRVSALSEELWDERTGRGNAPSREGARERDRDRDRVRERDSEDLRERMRDDDFRREFIRAERAKRNEQRRVDREHAVRERAERGRAGRERGQERTDNQVEQLHERLADLQREIENLRREIQDRN